MEATAPAVEFCRHIGLDTHGLNRLFSAINTQPFTWGEVAEYGWKSPEGQALLPSFVYYASPKGYIDWRSFVGATLVLDAAAKFGAISPGASIQPFVSGSRPAPVRFVRRGLFEQLIEAGRYPVSPSLQAPLPRLLLVLPAGSGEIVVNPEDNDEPAVLGITLADGEHGLSLRWCAWGRSGCSWTCPSQTEPDDHPLSTLAWGAIGLLASEPEVLELEPPAPTGRKLSKSARPSPAWLEPPVRCIRHGVAAEPNERGSVRPHWRRGHLHRYRCGQKRKQLIEHWRPAEWVGGSED